MLNNVPFKRRSIAAAALAVTLITGAGVFAWSAQAADSQTTPSGMPMHHDFEQMRMHRLADELSLNSQQQQLAMTAMQKMHPGKDAMEQMHKAHEQHLLALMDPNFDPRKAAAEADQMHAAMEAQEEGRSWRLVCAVGYPVARTAREGPPDAPKDGRARARSRRHAR